MFMGKQSCVWTPELTEYAYRLLSPEAEARKRSAAEALHQSPRRRRLAELKFAAWQRYFRVCGQNPALFLEKPLLIDFFLLDVERLAEFVNPILCPWLASLLSEVGEIARRTRPARAGMLNLLNAQP